MEHSKPSRKFYFASSSFVLNAITVVGLLITGILIWIGWQHGIFKSPETFAQFIQSLGWGAIPTFLFIQAVQVVIPILPAAIGCSVGVLVYGPWGGFLLNYVGICLGSCIAFLLARRYGLPLVKCMTSPRQFEKYSDWLTRGSTFDKLFAIAIFSPVAPDDFLCYLAGLTPMRFRRFLLIILLGKPLAIFLYSAGITAILTHFWH